MFPSGQFGRDMYIACHNLVVLLNAGIKQTPLVTDGTNLGSDHITM